MMTLTNVQAAAAETIKCLIAESDAAAITSIEKALEAGHALVSAKADCKHGEWIPFLERAGVHERKAQRLMKLAKSGLKSDTVSLLGGIKGALDFLAKRRLPSADEGLCVTPHSTIDNPFEAFEAAFIWPSRHAGFFHSAYFNDDGNGGMNVRYTKRPISGKPLAGEDESPVWLYENQMATPIEDRHYHRLSLPAVFAVADALGIVDCMYDASVEQFEALEKAQSVRTLESLSDLYGDAIARMRELQNQKTVANYMAATGALSAVTDAIVFCDDPMQLGRIAADETLTSLAQKLDAEIAAAA